MAARLAVLFELLVGVVADRLEHLIARVLVALIEHHERFLDQRLEQVDDVERRQRLGSAHLFGSGEVEPAHEDAEASEHLLFFGDAQQDVGPVDQGAQRLLSFEQDSSASRQQLEAVLQSGVDIRDGHRLHARGRQLEGQRNSFQAHDHLGDGRRLAAGQTEGRAMLLRPVDEKPHRRRSQQRGDVGIARRHRKRMHRIGLLARHAQRLPARSEDADLRSGAQDSVCQVGRRLGQVLAVVQNQEDAARLEVIA